MTSGIPFSKKELEYIKAHNPREFPSIIARGLANQYREYNGGYRCKESVAAIMKRFEEGATIDDLIQTAPPQEPSLPDLRKGKAGKKKPTPTPTPSPE